MGTRPFKAAVAEVGDGAGVPRFAESEFQEFLTAAYSSMVWRAHGRGAPDAGAQRGQPPSSWRPLSAPLQRTLLKRVRPSVEMVTRVGISRHSCGALSCARLCRSQ